MPRPLIPPPLTPSPPTPRGGQDAGGEMGKFCHKRRRQRLETDICVPDIQVLTINKGKSYYYFTTTYLCSISFSR